MKKIGICFGGYCPLHRGHLDQIMRSKKENDLTYVIVCGTGNTDREEQLGLSLREREVLIDEFFDTDDLIKVFSINEDEIGLEKIPLFVKESFRMMEIEIKFPDGLPEDMPTLKDKEAIRYNNWVKWLNYVEDYIKKDNSETYKTTYYVGEPDYKGFIDSILSRKATKVMPRTQTRISGTDIRKDPKKYWSYITAPFRYLYTKKVLITGPASEGKSILCEDIRKYFDLPGTDEFGRLYMETQHLHDTDLTINIMKDFMESQNTIEEAEMDRCTYDRTMICDSDVHTTLMYANAYIDDPDIPGITKEGYEKILVPLAEDLKRDWDLIILIPPHAKFVDDGLRYMKQSGLDERWKNYRFLLDILKKNYPEDIIKILPLNGTYYDNFLITKDYVEKLISE